MNSEIKKLRTSKNENDRKQALVLLSTYLLENPNDPEAWYDKAGCHDFLGEETEAEPCYQKAYDLGWRKLPVGEQRSFFVGFGSTLRNSLKFEKSREILEEGIRNLPEHPALKVFLAFTFYSQKQDRNAARVLFEAVIESSSKGLDGYEKAVKWYVEHLDIHPELRS